MCINIEQVIYFYSINYYQRRNHFHRTSTLMHIFFPFIKFKWHFTLIDIDIFHRWYYRRDRNFSGGKTTKWIWHSHLYYFECTFRWNLIAFQLTAKCKRIIALKKKVREKSNDDKNQHFDDFYFIFSWYFNGLISINDSNIQNTVTSILTWLRVLTIGCSLCTHTHQPIPKRLLRRIRNNFITIQPFQIEKKAHHTSLIQSKTFKSLGIGTFNRFD